MLLRHFCHLECALKYTLSTEHFCFPCARYHFTDKSSHCTGNYVHFHFLSFCLELCGAVKLSVMAFYETVHAMLCFLKSCTEVVGNVLFGRIGMNVASDLHLLCSFKYRCFVKALLCVIVIPRRSTQSSNEGRIFYLPAHHLSVTPTVRFYMIICFPTYM